MLVVSSRDGDRDGGITGAEGSSEGSSADSTGPLVQLYDLKNKYVGFNVELTCGVSWVLSCVDRLLVRERKPKPKV